MISRRQHLYCYRTSDCSSQGACRGGPAVSHRGSHHVGNCVGHRVYLHVAHRASHHGEIASGSAQLRDITQELPKKKRTGGLILIGALCRQYQRVAVLLATVGTFAVHSDESARAFFWAMLPTRSVVFIVEEERSCS